MLGLLELLIRDSGGAILRHTQISKASDFAGFGDLQKDGFGLRLQLSNSMLGAPPPRELYWAFKISRIHSCTHQP